MTDTDIAIRTEDLPQARNLVPTDRRLLPAPIEQLNQVGALIASAGALVNQDLRKDPGACTAVAYMAALHGTDPIATASQVYLVNGRLAFQAQYISALVRKHLDKPLKITFEGEGAQRFARVVGEINGEQLEYVSPRIGVIKVKNSPLWHVDPDQQLGAYYSVRAWARRHMPDVLLGIYAVDELQQVSIRDVTPVPPDAFAEDDGEVEEVEAELVTPGEPSGGANYGTAPTASKERQTPPGVQQDPPHDDPMAFASECEALVQECADKAALDALWSKTEANRRKLFDADRITSEALDDAFKARAKVLAGQ